jgi:hypothetical protein
MYPQAQPLSFSHRVWDVIPLEGKDGSKAYPLLQPQQLPNGPLKNRRFFQKYS